MLRRLVEHEVVEAREAGAGVVLLYRLNREHRASEPPSSSLITIWTPVVRELEREAITLHGLPAHELLAGDIP